MAEHADTFGKQAELLAALQSPNAYPHGVKAVTLLETHISWVLLTGEYAYKIKKAVKLEFLDFSSLERRRHYCEEELRLNRRWAPDLYLEVVAVTVNGDRLVIDGDGEAVEYAVRMLQFPHSAQLDRQLEAGALRETDLYSMAETVAGYHDRAPVIEYANDR